MRSSCNCRRGHGWMDGWMGGCDRVLIITDDVINACTNFTNVVIRFMRDYESKGGCNSSKI